MMIGKTSSSVPVLDKDITAQLHEQDLTHRELTYHSSVYRLLSHASSLTALETASSSLLP